MPEYVGQTDEHDKPTFPDTGDLLPHQEIVSQDDAWETKIILQRHTKYKGGFPEAGWGKATDEEKDALGHLTPEGIQEAREAADSRIDAVLTSDQRNVDFLVVASPTHWLGDPELGQRAIETGEIITEEILAKLEALGLPHEQLLKPWNPGSDEPVRQSDKLVEGQMFDTHLEFSDGLRKKYGGQGREFWDAYNADADREERKAVGAEGAPDAANRVRDQLDVLSRYAKWYHAENPDRKLVVFDVSHHEVIEPYAQHALGIQPKVFEPAYNDGIEINIDQAGVGHTTIAGSEIEVSFPAHGKSETIE